MLPIKVNFPENITDDLIGLFVVLIGVIAITVLVFIGNENLQNIAAGALIAWVGTVINSFLKTQKDSESGSN